MSFSNTSNLKVAVIVGLYRVGSIPNLYDDSTDDTLILALEIGDTVRYLRDTLPSFAGSVVHRLSEAVTGFSMSHTEAKVDALLGQAVMVDLVPSESFAALRQCRPFPSPPKFSAPGFRFVTSDSRLGGKRDGVVAIGGSKPVTTSAYPAAPAPLRPVTSWDLRSLTRAVLPAGLPAIVAQYVLRSNEWKELEAEAAPAPSKARR